LLSCSRAAFTRAVQRVAFTVIEKRQTAASALLVQDAAKFVAKSVARLVGDNSALTRVLANPEQIGSVVFSGDEVGRLKNLFKKAVGNSYLDGVSTGRNEIDRGGYNPTDAAPQRQTFASVRDVAAEYLDANAFRMAGNVSEAVRGILQQELLNGVKSGKGVAEVRTSIWNRLVAKGMTSEEQVRGVETDEGINAALDALWVDTEAQAAAYLNTVARTNLFDAFNEGRFAEFTDPALGGFVEALEYSAVLDDRTTQLCQQLDGTVWNADSPNWDTFRPPNHFNCRSILVAVTQVDIARGEWDGVESQDPPEGLQPADGFGAGDK
jgi:SPP1 gp7 family putative phage head morphogenesis protein